MQYLEFNAGKDPLEDRYIAGLLAGINEVLNVTTDDISEENPENGS